MAVPRLARPLLPDPPPGPRVAPSLRGCFFPRGGQQRLLPAGPADGLRELARAHARRLRRRGEDEPVPDAHPPAARARRAGAPFLLPRRRARAEARPGAVAAAADPRRGRRRHRRRPRAVPARGEDRGGAAPPVVVDGGDREGAAPARGGPVLGRPAQPAGDAAVAHGGLRVPATARGPGGAAT